MKRYVVVNLFTPQADGNTAGARVELHTQYGFLKKVEGRIVGSLSFGYEFTADVPDDAVIFIKDPTGQAVCQVICLDESNPMTTKETTLQAIQDDLKRKARDIQVTTHLLQFAEELRAAVNKRNHSGISQLVCEHATVRELLPVACQVFEQMQAELKEAGINIPDLEYDGITYKGSAEKDDPRVFSAILPPLYHLKKAHRHSRADHGYWKLTENGDFEVGGTPEPKVASETDGAQVTIHRHSEVNRGEVTLNTAMVTNARITQKVETLSGLYLADGIHTWRLGDGVKLGTDEHFNHPQMLPPVPCELYVKVPAGSRWRGRGLEDIEEGRTAVDQIVRVTRTTHLTNKDDEMEYQLGPHEHVYGRFHWTYP